MDKIIVRWLLPLVFATCSVTVTAAPNIDERRDWKDADEVVRAATTYLESAFPDKAGVATGSALMFGVHRIEMLLVPAKGGIRLEASRAEVVIGAVLRNRSLREIAINGCLMALSEVQSIAPDGAITTLNDYYAARSVEDVVRQREDALQALKDLTASGMKNSLNEATRQLAPPK